MPPWLQRFAVDECGRRGLDPDSIEPDLELVARDAADTALTDLADLLATDVDEQRTTPLSLLRASTAPISEFVHRHAPAGAADSGAGRGGHDPAGPATWSDVDPALHVPGLTWGAWKAMTVLARRRDEGLR